MGVNKSRRPHDIFWLLLLIICWAAMCAVAYFAFQKGSLDRLTKGRDTEGNLCGSEIGIDSKRNLSSMPYLYYFNLADKAGYQRCVSQCPNVTYDFNTVLCMYNVTPANTQIQKAQQVKNGVCVYTWQSAPILNRCIPDFILTGVNKAANASNVNVSTLTDSQTNLGEKINSIPIATMIYQNVINSWYIIVGSAGICFGLSIVWLLLAQLFTGFIVWSTLLGSFLSTGLIAAFFLYNYYLVFVLGGEALVTGDVTLDTQLYNQYFLLSIGIVAALIAFILLCLIVFCCSRIRLAVAIIKEASKAMRTMPLITILPIVQYVILGGLCVWTVFIMMLLSTSGDYIVQEVVMTINNATQSTTANQFINNNTLLYLQIFFVFGFFWTYNFIVAIGQTTVASAVADWYFTREKSGFRPLAPLKALGVTLLYNAGSLALGSMLIAIVQTIRYVLHRLQKYAKASQNQLARIILACCQCCFCCLEKLLKFISKNAYIEIAINGGSFCSACKKAFEIMVSNVLRLLVVDRVSAFIMFLGKIIIVSATAFLGFLILSRYQPASDPLTSWATPMVLIFIAAWIIATGFLSVFDMAIDTIFICFCEDSKQNDGSPQKPYFMSEALGKFLNTYRPKPGEKSKFVRDDY